MLAGRLEFQLFGFDLEVHVKRVVEINSVKELIERSMSCGKKLLGGGG